MRTKFAGRIYGKIIFDGDFTIRRCRLRRTVGGFIFYGCQSVILRKIVNVTVIFRLFFRLACRLQGEAGGILADGVGKMWRIYVTEM